MGIGMWSWVKRSVALLMVLVMLGSVVSPVMAAESANECSDGLKITIQRNTGGEYVEVTGPERAKILLDTITKASVQVAISKLVDRGYHADMGRLKVVKADGRVFVIVPLTKSDEKAVLVHVIDGVKTATVVGVVKEGTVSVFVVDGKGFLYLNSWNIKCDVCKWAVGGLCAGAMNRGCEGGCLWLCGKVPHLVWAAVCFVVCEVACNFLLTYEACSLTASEACRRAGLC